MNLSQKSQRTVNAGAASVGKPPLPRPAPIGRRERRTAETRIRLFRSALQLIAERGLSMVTVGTLPKPRMWAREPSSTTSPARIMCWGDGRNSAGQGEGSGGDGGRGDAADP